MKRKGLLTALIVSMAVTSLAGCKNTKKAQEKVKGLDKLGKVHVISREEGSGSRNTFAELAGFKDNNSSNQDNTLEGAEIAEDTSSVLNKVGSDPAAIGYGSAGVMVSASQVKVLAEEYMKQNPRASIKVTQTDSGNGINQTIQGKCDMGISSRELRNPEKELLNYEAIARDEIAVIVNAANPLNDITMDQLEAVYTGKTTEWKDIYR